MKCSGDGLLYLADYGADVVVINLNGDGISVNATNLPRLRRPSDLGRGAGQGPGRIRRAGPVEHQHLRPGLGRASPPRGKPIVVDCGGGEDETYVDPDALVAWSRTSR